MLQANKTVTYKKKATKGSGDCVFHAVFGTWDYSIGQYECKDVAAKRKTFSQNIRLCNSPNHSHWPIIKTIFMAYIMEEHALGPYFKRAIENYKKQQDNRSLIATAWGQLVISLKDTSHQTANHYFKEFFKKKKYHHRYTNEEALYTTTNFQLCLNESKFFLGIIMSLPQLHQAYKNYCASFARSQWSAIVDGIPVTQLFNEYTAHIEKPGTWMLPIELRLLAEIEKIGLDYYTSVPNNANTSPILIDCYNSKTKKRIAVCFNGINHYERMVSEQEARKLTSKGLIGQSSVIKIAPPLVPSIKLIPEDSLNKISEYLTLPIEELEKNRGGRLYQHHVEFNQGDFAGTVNAYGQPDGLGVWNKQSDNYCENYQGQWRQGKFEGHGCYRRETILENHHKKVEYQQGLFSQDKLIDGEENHYIEWFFKWSIEVSDCVEQFIYGFREIIHLKNFGLREWRVEIPDYGWVSLFIYQDVYLSSLIKDKKQWYGDGLSFAYQKAYEDFQKEWLVFKKKVDEKTLTAITDFTATLKNQKTIAQLFLAVNAACFSTELKKYLKQLLLLQGLISVLPSTYDFRYASHNPLAELFAITSSPSDLNSAITVFLQPIPSTLTPFSLPNAKGPVSSQKIMSGIFAQLPSLEDFSLEEKQGYTTDIIYKGGHYSGLINEADKPEGLGQWHREGVMGQMWHYEGNWQKGLYHGYGNYWCNELQGEHQRLVFDKFWGEFIQGKQKEGLQVKQFKITNIGHCKCYFFKGNTNLFSADDTRGNIGKLIITIEQNKSYEVIGVWFNETIFPFPSVDDRYDTLACVYKKAQLIFEEAFNAVCQSALNKIYTTPNHSLHQEGRLLIQKLLSFHGQYFQKNEILQAITQTAELIKIEIELANTTKSATLGEVVVELLNIHQIVTGLDIYEQPLADDQKFCHWLDDTIKTTIFSYCDHLFENFAAYQEKEIQQEVANTLKCLKEKEDLNYILALQKPFFLLARRLQINEFCEKECPPGFYGHIKNFLTALKENKDVGDSYQIATEEYEHSYNLLAQISQESNNSAIPFPLFTENNEGIKIPLDAEMLNACYLKLLEFYYSKAKNNWRIQVNRYLNSTYLPWLEVWQQIFSSLTRDMTEGPEKFQAEYQDFTIKVIALVEKLLAMNENQTANYLQVKNALGLIFNYLFFIGESLAQMPSTPDKVIILLFKFSLDREIAIQLLKEIIKSHYYQKNLRDFMEEFFPKKTLAELPEWEDTTQIELLNQSPSTEQQQSVIYLQKILVIEKNNGYEIGFCKGQQGKEQQYSQQRLNDGQLINYIKKNNAPGIINDAQFKAEIKKIIQKYNGIIREEANAPQKFIIKTISLAQALIITIKKIMENFLTMCQVSNTINITVVLEALKYLNAIIYSLASKRELFYFHIELESIQLPVCSIEILHSNETPKTIPAGTIIFYGCPEINKYSFSIDGKKIITVDATSDIKQLVRAVTKQMLIDETGCSEGEFCVPSELIRYISFANTQPASAIADKLTSLFNQLAVATSYKKSSGWNSYGFFKSKKLEKKPSDRIFAIDYSPENNLPKLGAEKFALEHVVLKLLNNFLEKIMETSKVADNIESHQNTTLVFLTRCNEIIQTGLSTQKNYRCIKQFELNMHGYFKEGPSSHTKNPDYDQIATDCETNHHGCTHKKEF